MIDILLYEVAPGVLQLIVYMTVGILLGYVLEILGIVQRLGRLTRPLISWANLPPVCSTAFVTALASQKAAGAMLSDAYTNRRISRRAAVLGAVANTVPGALIHLRVAGPVLILMLGMAGVAYTAFIVANAVIVLTLVLVIGHFSGPASKAHSDFSGENTEEQASKRPDKSEIWRRCWRLLPRVLIVAVPVYALAAILTEMGVFENLLNKLPDTVTSAMPPEALAIIAVQMASTIQAAPVAKSFLDTGSVEPVSLFFILVMGYVLSLPGRLLRRSLPSTLSLFPGRNGLYIVALSHGPRLAVALAVSTCWIVLQLKGA